jgi:hypothetical protein
LADAGRPLTHTALDKIERGTRRVDVDDATCQPSAPAHVLWDVLRAAPFRETDGTMNCRHRLDWTPPWAIADLGITVASVDFNRETDDGND